MNAAATGTEDKRVGFVGLGNIGLPAACNLVQRGHPVIGFDLRRNEAFEAAGGTPAATVADVAAAPVIAFSLPSGAAVAEALDALLPVLRPGQVIVDLTSCPIATKREHARLVAERGATLLDCEVSGLPMQVTARSAVLFLAGDATTITRLAPLFSAITDRHFHVGDFGAATTLKLIANTMVCVNNLMAAEALNLGARAGLDPTLMAQVLGPSAAGSLTFTNKAPLMLSRQFEAGKGPFRHMFGYLARAAELATASGARTPLLDAVRPVYAQAEQQGRHDQDIAAVIELLEGRGGSA